jgi:phage terminase large subunit-like protein
MLAMEKERRQRERKISLFYPDEGKFRRELYPKHCEFFNAGVDYRQRLMLAANRVGKTEGVGLYELVLHATGWYPEWWCGRRFAKPVRAWAAGDTGKTVREILQLKLLGPVGSFGTGLIPGECLEKVVRGGGVADSIEIMYIKHKSGALSSITLKSYDQRVEAFQGTEIDIILLDEEPPEDIYVECLMRTMTNNGMIMLTFTPLLGISNVVLKFLPDGRLTGRTNNKEVGKYVVMATWDDVPHLSEKAKKELWESIPPFQRDARSKGIPQLGAGAIFPINEEEITVKDFDIPAKWPRAYGFDVGWKKTAAVWGAYDKQSDVIYLYSQYYRGQAEPDVHASGIKARGSWMKGHIDPAANGRGQKDGSRLLAEYRKLGLKLEKAPNAVEAGLLEMWQMFSTGRIKVFSSLQDWFMEYRLYRRDEDGDVVKENDHLMDATRYLILAGTKSTAMTRKPAKRGRADIRQNLRYGYTDQSWLK